MAAKRGRVDRARITDDFTSEWFAEQRAFYEDPSQLVAAICGRRAGKTRGGNRHFVKQASTTTHGRFLYLNETRAEARRLAWIGARGDGMASIVQRLKLPAVCNGSDLTIHFPDIDSWIYLIGADDEAGVSKALGMPYHEIWWDEFQKVRPTLGQTIREVMMPTLLDYRGRFRVTGTPKRNAVGMFHDITQPDKSKRARGWSVHHWNLLSNPFFGRAETRKGKLYVVARLGDVISGPHEPGEIEAAVRGARWTQGIIALQELLGGADVAPIGSPLLRREGLGEWAYEASAYVYPVHAVDQATLCYAPARLRTDGFPDIERALKDLPGWVDERAYFMVLGVDLGYSPDPFAFALWAWSLEDPVLYEVCSWKRTELDSDQQVAIIKTVRDTVPVSMTVADAGGGGKQVVAGWSKDWVQRYSVPIVEATKKNKHGAIGIMGTDVLQGHLRCREGGVWLEEAREHQWLSIVSATGRQVEDPTTQNHVLDASLYAHRESYHHRYREPAPKIVAGSPEWVVREERELESAALEPEDRGPYARHW